LAAALKKQPRYLLLDEPTVGLDTKNWSIVASQLVQARREGAQILLATHDSQLLPLVDEIIRVEPVKRLAVTKTPDSVSPLAVVAVSMLLLVGSMAFGNLLGLGAALGLELAIYLTAAVRLRRWGNPKVLVPVAIGLGSIFISNWWLSSQPDLTRAGFDALRVAYFVLPSVLLVETIRASVFGDQLGQILRLPARPVIAAMVAIGRLERLQSSWRTLSIVRRLQGLTYRSGPAARLREAAAMTLALTLDAIRAAQTASVAMEARGFNNRDLVGRLIKRTWAVAAKWGRLDGWLAAAAVASLLVGFTLGRF
jgi:energy-coupling factor transporter transmembrane protein EcfT